MIAGSTARPNGPQPLNNLILSPKNANDLTAPNCTPIKKLPLEAKPCPTEEGRYILDNHQLTAAGMRKLARNWENCLTRIDRASDGQLMLRRSSDSSEISTNSSGSGKDSEDNLVKRRGVGESADTSASGEILANGDFTGNGSKMTRSGSATSSSSGGSRSTDSLEARAPWKPY